MTTTRAMYVVLLLGAVSVTVVGLRTEQTRIAARTVQLQREGMALRRKAWVLHIEVARLRTPSHIRDRVARWSLNVFEPSPPGDVTPTLERVTVR